MFWLGFVLGAVAMLAWIVIGLALGVRVGDRFKRNAG